MTFINLLVEPALHGDIWEDTFHRVMRDLTLSQEPNCFKLNHYFPSYVYDEAGRMRENLVKRQRSIEHSAETLQRELMRYRSDHSEVTSYIAAHIEAKQAVRSELDWYTHTQQTQVPLRFDVSKIRETWHDLITLDRRMDTFRRCGYYEDAEVHSLAHGLDHAMNWLLDALDVLRTNYGRITEARAQFTPIFRLNDDVLSIVFELLADAEAPTLYRLGWFKLTHVCSAWRRVLLGMSRLWARDAYVYGTSIASSYLLSRTQCAPVSVGTVRLTSAYARLDTGSELGLGLVRFREHLRPLIHLASEERLRDLHGLYIDDTSLVYILERILCDGIQPHLRSISIWLQRGPLVEGKLRVMAPHPNLRHAIFWNMFIPFSLPNLVSLQLLCSKFGEGIRTIPQAWLDSMLDSLESCSALIDLRIMHYILPSPSTQRRITVPHLESLSCTDSSVFDILHLPALRRVKAPIEVQAPADQAAPSLRTGLSAIFGRYGLSPRSLNISQREGRTPQHPSALFVRLGGEPLGYPPSPSLPLDWSSFTLEEPGPFVSFAFGIHRETGTRALSLLFSEYTRVVHSIPGTDTIDTLAFDNETREHTFDREDGFISPATTQEPVWGLSLPSFPAVRKIVLPFRDNDTIYHIISSLVTDENCLHLPQLSCLSFNGPLHMAHTFMEIYPALASLLRVRAAPVMGVLPMTSLEFELFVDGALALLEDADDWIEPLRRTLAKAVRSGLGDRASITIQQEYAVADSGSGFPYFRLLATITYDT